MRRSQWLSLIGTIALVMLAAGPLMRERSPHADAFTRDLQVEKGELVSIGRNPYFILEPGYFLV